MSAKLIICSQFDALTRMNMAPLTLSAKYDDLVRCADQPLSAYSKLSHEDFEDVMSQAWPFIIESITSTPFQYETSEAQISTAVSTGEVRFKLDRRLKIQYPLYSEAAARNQQPFPARMVLRRQRNCKFDQSRLQLNAALNSDRTRIQIRIHLTSRIRIHRRAPCRTSMFCANLNVRKNDGRRGTSIYGRICQSHSHLLLREC